MRKLKVSRTQAYIGISVVFLSCILFAVILRSLWGGVKQPLAFNHKIHKENDVECLDCHANFKTQASSGRPSIQTCSSCHEEQLGKSRAERDLMEYIKNGQEIEWQRLYKVPRDVYFSHRRHVILGNIECQICHGDIGDSSKPQVRPKKIKMKKCMNCHREKGVSNDCISCHM